MVLCIVFCCCYYRASHVEQGKSSEIQYTFVGINASYLPIAFLLLFLLAVILKGPGRWNWIFGLLMDLTVTVSLFYAWMLAILPLLRKFISARDCALLWLIPVLTVYMPANLQDSARVPRWTVSLPLLDESWLFPLWIGSGLVIFGIYVLRHFVFLWGVRRHSAPVTDSHVQQLWQEALEKANFARKHPPKLLLSTYVRAPLSVSTFGIREKTILPHLRYTDAEFSLIFHHEILHLQRCDPDTKVFLAFCKSFFWFNPLVWLASNRACEDLELSCDERVVENLSEEGRRQYASLLLDNASDGRGFTTCLSASAGSLRYRLNRSLRKSNRASGIVLLTLTLFLCILFYGSVGITASCQTLSRHFASHPVTKIVNMEIPGIGYVSDDTAAWDTDAILSYLGSVPAERYITANRFDTVGEPFCLYARCTKGWFAITGDTVMYVDGRNSTFYRLTEPIDWDRIRENVALHSGSSRDGN